VKNISLPNETDQIFPLVATEYLGNLASITFLIGIAAAAYSSADTSITGLTTSFCIDFLGYLKFKKDNVLIRRLVHLGFTLLVFLLILIFRSFNDQSVISAFIKLSGYAYGPLLALFVFGMFTRKSLYDKWVPLVCVISPFIAYIIDRNSVQLLGYQLNYETIIVNSLVAIAGLYVLHIYNGKVYKR
jgi:Na+/proline symporter